ncbi:hypothetical protein OUZ56_028593 [Daphnia magna]|uniref:Uncharacterized protein n=1 Tax=Daphnia magna TaxID=35525 RepID=A0ABR0B4B6_9CRUS|nr:hypothetical protein OUZ56_028593 [Daphnia magna]
MGIVCPLRTDARKESRTPNAGCPVSVYTSEFRESHGMRTKMKKNSFNDHRLCNTKRTGVCIIASRSVSTSSTVRINQLRLVQ